MGAAQLGCDFGVREPGRELSAGEEPLAQLGPGDVQRLQACRHLVLGEVFVALRDVHEHREGDHADADLVCVPAEHFLGLVRAIERSAVAVLARAGVVAADDEVRAPVVLADDRVPYGFARAAHPHRQRQQGQHCSPFRVATEQGLIAADPGVVVDVARLGHPHDRVDQHVGVDSGSGAQGQLLVRSVHRVARLESDDPAPAASRDLSVNLPRVRRSWMKS